MSMCIHTFTPTVEEVWKKTESSLASHSSEMSNYPSVLVRLHDVSVTLHQHLSLQEDGEFPGKTESTLASHSSEMSNYSSVLVRLHDVSVTLHLPLSLQEIQQPRSTFLESYPVVAVPATLRPLSKAGAEIVNEIKCSACASAMTLLGIMDDDAKHFASVEEMMRRRVHSSKDCFELKERTNASKSIVDSGLSFRDYIQIVKLYTTVP
ncbi:hypothetical protein J6590_007687 [Homalodisca vitripennis]|nr:hypothetical protein J6590_007687 [Homalodisca vitripennis]